MLSNAGVFKLMQFRKFWKIEYTLTLFAIFAIVVLLLPTTIQSARQASLISRWNEKYNRVNYMFSVLNTHANEDIIQNLKNTQNMDEKSKLMILLMQPYLRISSDNIPTKRYRPRYMNNSRIKKNHLFYFDNFYFAENNTIIGIKDLPQQSAEDPLFMLMFDMNGLIPPNRWGKDIFGVNIYSQGYIEPFGRQYDLSEVKFDCSEKGLGIKCSYYYIIGGGFDE